MPLDASTAHTVNRLVVDTDTAFYDVRHSYESLVPTIDFAELTALVKAGALSEVKQYTAEHAPHTFSTSGRSTRRRRCNCSGTGRGWSPT